MDRLTITGDVCRSTKEEIAISELKKDVKMVRIAIKYKHKHVNTPTVHMHKNVIPKCNMSLL